MNEPAQGSRDSPSPHTYFVDETGDGVIFDGKGRVLVGTGKVADYFTLGMVECRTLDALTADLAALRTQLLADAYFKGVPSMQPAAKKTALYFHAKDDLPEVRREVFRVIQGHDFSFYAVVRTMSAVVRGVKWRNERDPTYRYRPTELYDSAVRRLFDKKLHTRPAFEVIFATRGKARTHALRSHLLEAQDKSRKAAGTYPDATIHVRAMHAHQQAGLQLADYCLWALQRLFSKGEERFLSLIWPKVGLIVDADDISEKPYGTYHTRKRPPLTAEGIKNRKVED
jgi:hypothetical protein